MKPDFDTAAFAAGVFLIIVLAALGIRGDYKATHELKMACIDKGLAYNRNVRGCVHISTPAPQEARREG